MRKDLETFSWYVKALQVQRVCACQIFASPKPERTHPVWKGGLLLSPEPPLQWPSLCDNHIVDSFTTRPINLEWMMYFLIPETAIFGFMTTPTSSFRKRLTLYSCEWKEKVCPWFLGKPGFELLKILCTSYSNKWCFSLGMSMMGRWCPNRDHVGTVSLSWIVLYMGHLEPSPPGWERETVLFKRKCMFPQCMMNLWNSLPQHMVTDTGVGSFRKGLANLNFTEWEKMSISCEGWMEHLCPKT